MFDALLEGATTLRRTTLSIKTFSIIALNITSLSKNTFSMTHSSKVSIMILNTTILCLKALTIMTHSITFRIMICSKATLGISIITDSA